MQVALYCSVHCQHGNISIVVKSAQGWGGTLQHNDLLTGRPSQLGSYPSIVPLHLFFFNIIVLNIIPTLYEGYIVSVHRMVMESRPVDLGSIQGSHRPIFFIKIKHRTRADDTLCKPEY